MGSRKRKALSILAASSMLGLAFFATKPALAGTNGQRILFCRNGTDYQRVSVEGVNQNGTFSQFAYPVNFDKNVCEDPADDFGADYWVGEVKLTWMQSASGNFPRHKTTCLIPKESTIDTTTCIPRIDQ